MIDSESQLSKDIKEKNCDRCTHEKTCVMSTVATVCNTCNFFNEK